MEEQALDGRKEMFRSMLTDAVTVLCRNSVPYSMELCIEGLIGITTDKKDVLLVSIKELLLQTTSKNKRDETPKADHTGKSRKRKKMKVAKSSDSESEDECCKKREVENVERQKAVECDTPEPFVNVKNEPVYIKSDSDTGDVLDSFGFSAEQNLKVEPLQSQSQSEYCHEWKGDSVLEQSGFPPSLDQSSHSVGLSKNTNTGQSKDNTYNDSSVTPSEQSKSSSPVSTHTPDFKFVQSPVNELYDESGTKVYQCNFCSKIIRSKGNFGRHLKGHIKQTENHVCTICRKGFGRRDNLKRHVMMIHQLETPTPEQMNLDSGTELPQDQSSTSNIATEQASDSTDIEKVSGSLEQLTSSQEAADSNLAQFKEIDQGQHTYGTGDFISPGEFFSRYNNGSGMNQGPSLTMDGNTDMNEDSKHEISDKCGQDVHVTTPSEYF